MVQKIGPRELALRAQREAIAEQAEKDAKAQRAEAKKKPTVDALREAAAQIPVKRRAKVKKL